MTSRIIHNKGLILLVVGLLVYAGLQFTAGSGEAKYANISPEEAKRVLDSGEEVILLDVRTAAENFEVRIPDSVLIPVDEIESALSILPDKNARIFVYCRSGRRSVTASVALVNMGYTRVYNLGGIIDWPYEKESA